MAFTHIYSDVAHHGSVVWQTNVLSLVMFGGGATVGMMGCIGAIGRGGALVDNKSALDVDSDATWVVDGAVNLGGGGRCPRPANLFGCCDRILGRRSCAAVRAVLQGQLRVALSHDGGGDGERCRVSMAAENIQRAPNSRRPRGKFSGEGVGARRMRWDG